MEAWQNRVIEENSELTERLVKLVAFLASPVALKMDEAALGLMMRQAEVMLEYQRVLVTRIRGFS